MTAQGKHSAALGQLPNTGDQAPTGRQDPRASLGLWNRMDCGSRPRAALRPADADLRLPWAIVRGSRWGCQIQRAAGLGHRGQRSGGSTRSTGGPTSATGSAPPPPVAALPPRRWASLRPGPLPTPTWCDWKSSATRPASASPKSPAQSAKESPAAACGFTKRRTTRWSFRSCGKIYAASDSGGQFRVRRAVQGCYATGRTGNPRNYRRHSNSPRYQS